MPLDQLKTLILDLEGYVSSTTSDAHLYLSSTERSDFSQAVDDAIEEEGGEPQGYQQTPILNVAPAVGVLSGIMNGIGLLAPIFEGAAGQWMKSLLQEMQATLPSGSN